jgi:hypothetical protein
MAIFYMYHALEGVDCVTCLVEVDPNVPCENYEQTRGHRLHPSLEFEWHCLTNAYVVVVMPAVVPLLGLKFLLARVCSFGRRDCVSSSSQSDFLPLPSSLHPRSRS